MLDHALSLRKAVVKHLLADAAVRALVNDRVYGEEAPAKPQWPFVRYGLPIDGLYEASGWDGKEHDLTLHAFARGPGMDDCSTLATAIQTAMSEDSGLPLVGIGLVGITFLRTQIVRDSDEKGAYHAIIQFTATTFEEAA